jgi:hypothetical protein
VLSVGWLVLSITLGVVVARAVFASGQVSYHRIVGAILLYILVALAFVALYLIVGLTAPDAFKDMVFDDARELTSQLIYFSCSTLTTLGYGDIVPVNPFARKPRQSGGDRRPALSGDFDRASRDAAAAGEWMKSLAANRECEALFNRSINKLTHDRVSP